MQRNTYKKFTGKNLNESEIAVVFVGSEGFSEKEIRFDYRITEPLKTNNEIAFDLRVIETAALLSKQKNSLLVIENVLEKWSEERILKLVKMKPELELPEGPNYIRTTLKFYDQLGSLLMEEKREGCNVNLNISDKLHPVEFRGIDQTFAISDNGHKFGLCEFCESGGCFIYSPFLNESYKLKTVPIFQGTVFFSPSARYLAYEHSSPENVTFMDLDEKISTEISSKSIRSLKVFDDGTLMIKDNVGNEISYDLHGNIIKKPNE